MCSGTRATGVTEQSYVKESSPMFHGSDLPPQEKQGIVMGLSKESLRRTLLCNDIDSFDIHRGSKRLFENVVSTDTLPICTEEDRDGGKWRKAIRLLGFHKQKIN